MSQGLDIRSNALHTRLFARALGPFFIVFGIAVAMKAGVMELFVPAFFQEGALVFVTGAFTLLLGLGIIAVHNRWDGLAAIIISVFAIITAIRGALLMIAPSFIASLSADFVRLTGLIFIPATIAVMIGAYLTYVGWIRKT